MTTVAEIRAASCRHFNVNEVTISSRRTDAQAVRARHIAMYLARQLTPLSLPNIGRQFGGRDHTTVLYAVRKVASSASLCNEAYLVECEMRVAA
jgi:chromosomal replication initiator protein